MATRKSKSRVAPYKVRKSFHLIFKSFSASGKMWVLTNQTKFEVLLPKIKLETTVACNSYLWSFHHQMIILWVENQDLMTIITFMKLPVADKQSHWKWKWTSIRFFLSARFVFKFGFIMRRKQHKIIYELRPPLPVWLSVDPFVYLIFLQRRNIYIFIPS